MKQTFLMTLVALLASIPAHAGSVSVPEPDVLPLLGLGIAAAVAVKLMRRKK